MKSEGHPGPLNGKPKGPAIRQKLIDLYLLDCAKRGKKLRMKWVS